MHWMRRAVAILPALVLALAACAPAGSGGGDQTDDATDAPVTGAPTSEATTSAAPMSPSASGSPPESDDGAGAPSARVDIDDLLTDPAVFVDAGEVTIAENVDEVLAEDAAFLISGTLVEGDMLVVLTPDAQVDKEIEADRVVDITGTVVAIDELGSAGAALEAEASEIAGYEGEFAIVATGIGDPLEG